MKIGLQKKRKLDYKKEQIKQDINTKRIDSCTHQHFGAHQVQFNNILGL